MAVVTGVKRKKLIDAYIETQAQATMFLSSFFQSPQRNFFDTEEVEVDIKRGGRRIAIAVHDITSGARKNVSDLFQNKKFKPPVLKESAPLTVEQVAFNREPGEDPFSDQRLNQRASAKAMMITSELEEMHRRTIELQAAQVLSGGVVTLVNQNNNTIYELDFQVRPTHHTTAATAWGSVGATPLGDIETIGKNIVTNGKSIPGILVFGSKAWNAFFNTPEVQEALNLRRANIVEVDPASRGMGAVAQGRIWIGQYQYEMWTYDGQYEDPVTGDTKYYLEEDQVLVLSKEARLDLVFGNVPRFGRSDREVLNFVPDRVSNRSGGMDLILFAKMNDDKTAIDIEVDSRPLCVPTAIDTFGSIKTNAP